MEEFLPWEIKLYRLPILRIEMLGRARKRLNTLGCLRKFDIQSARPSLALSRRTLRERETLWIWRRCFTHGRMSLRAPRRPLDFEFVSDLYSSRHRHRRRRRRRRRRVFSRRAIEGTNATAFDHAHGFTLKSPCPNECPRAARECILGGDGRSGKCCGFIER